MGRGDISAVSSPSLGGGRGNVTISPVTTPGLVSISVSDPISHSPGWQPSSTPTATGSKILVDPRSTGALPNQAARELTMPGQGTVQGCAWGHVQQGGNVVFAKAANGFFYVGYVLVAHEIHAYTKINIAGRELKLPSLGGDGTFGWTAGHFKFTAPTFSGFGDNYRLYTGTNTQTLDNILHGLDSRWVYAYNGTETTVSGKPIGQKALFWYSFPFAADGSTPVPDPWQMTAEFDAALIYDPRLDPTLTTKYFSTNSALINADAKLRFPLKGRKEEIDWDAIAEEADTCDEVMGDGSKRYEMSVVLRDAVSWPQLEDSLRQHCMGAWVRNSKKWRFYIAHKRTWSGFSITDGSDGQPANIRDGVELGVVTKGSDAIPSRVEVQYTDEADKFTQKSVFYPKEGTDDSRPKVYQLVGLMGSVIASRVAETIYKLGQQDKLVPLAVNEVGTQILPGMVIKATLDGGPTAQQVMVTDVKTVGGEGLGWDLDTEFYDDSMYPDSTDSQDSTSGDPLPSPSDPPPAPTECSVVEVARPSSDGSLVDTLRLSWTPPSTFPFFNGTRITVDVDGTGETDVAILGKGASTYDFTPTAYDVPHTFRLYSIGQDIQSDPTTFDLGSGVGMARVTPVFNTAVVPEVEDLTAPHSTQVELGQVWWNPPSNYLFVDYYEVFDFFDPLNPVLISTVKFNAIPTSARPLNAARAIHGDGITGPQTFSIGVRTVNSLGVPSEFAEISWGLEPLGSVDYQVGQDPRDCVFDGTFIWVCHAGDGTVRKVAR